MKEKDEHKIKQKIVPDADIWFRVTALVNADTVTLHEYAPNPVIFGGRNS